MPIIRSFLPGNLVSYLSGASVPNPLKTVVLHDKGGAVFDVMAYGAAGDGVTDDTGAILAAVAAAQATSHGGVIFFPPGVYLVLGQLAWPNQTAPIVFCGESMQRMDVSAAQTTGGSRLDLRWRGGLEGAVGGIYNRFTGDYAVLTGLDLLWSASTATFSITAGSAYINNATATTAPVALSASTTQTVAALANGDYWVDYDGSTVGINAVGVSSLFPAFNGTLNPAGGIRIARITVASNVITRVIDARGRVKKIDTRNFGFFGLKDLTLTCLDTARTSDEVPLFGTTCTRLLIDNVSFTGSKAAGFGAAALQDAIHLGGPGGTTGYRNGGWFSDSTATCIFQGYGSILRNVHFNYVRRAVFHRAAANGIVLENLNIWSSCGADWTMGAIDFDSPTVSCYRGQITNVLCEAEFYSWPIRFGNNAFNVRVTGVHTYDSPWSYLNAPTAVGGSTLSLRDGIAYANALAWKGRPISVDFGWPQRAELAWVSATAPMTGHVLGILTAPVSSGTTASVASFPSAVFGTCLATLTATVSSGTACSVTGSIAVGASIILDGPTPEYFTVNGISGPDGNGYYTLTLSGAIQTTHTVGANVHSATLGATLVNSVSSGTVITTSAALTAGKTVVLAGATIEAFQVLSSVPDGAGNFTTTLSGGAIAATHSTGANVYVASSAFVIVDGATQEAATITSVNGSGPYTLTFAGALAASHATNATIYSAPWTVTVQSPLQFAHPLNAQIGATGAAIRADSTTSLGHDVQSVHATATFPASDVTSITGADAPGMGVMTSDWPAIIQNGLTINGGNRINNDRIVNFSYKGTIKQVIDTTGAFTMAVSIQRTATAGSAGMTGSALLVTDAPSNADTTNDLIQLQSKLSGATADRVRVNKYGGLGVNGSGAIAYGTSGQLLRSGGASAAPTWAAISTTDLPFAYDSAGRPIAASGLAPQIRLGPGATGSTAVQDPLVSLGAVGNGVTPGSNQVALFGTGGALVLNTNDVLYVGYSWTNATGETYFSPTTQLTWLGAPTTTGQVQFGSIPAVTNATGAKYYVSSAVNAPLVSGFPVVFDTTVASVVSGGVTPATSVNTLGTGAAGKTANTTNSAGAQATATLTNATDTAGSLSILTAAGSTLTAGILCQLTFVQLWSRVPTVTLTPTSATTAGKNPYHNATASRLPISTASALVAATAYPLNYAVLG